MFVDYFIHIAQWVKYMEKEKYNKIKYNNKYNKENYARLSVQVSPEEKPIIENHWKNKGFKSFNSYVKDLIRRDMYENSENATKVVKIDRNETININ